MKIITWDTSYSVLDAAINDYGDIVLLVAWMTDAYDDFNDFNLITITKSIKVHDASVRKELYSGQVGMDVSDGKVYITAGASKIYIFNRKSTLVDTIQLKDNYYGSRPSLCIF